VDNEFVSSESAVGMRKQKEERDLHYMLSHHFMA